MIVDCRPGPADIVFVVDTSRSMGNTINKSIDYISQFLRKIPIGQDDFQVGAITFSIVPEILFDLDDYSSANDIITVLNQTARQDGATFTSVALNKAFEVRINTLRLKSK